MNHQFRLKFKWTELNLEKKEPWLPYNQVKHMPWCYTIATKVTTTNIMYKLRTKNSLIN